LKDATATGDHLDLPLFDIEVEHLIEPEAAIERVNVYEHYKLA
jgi:hypothetical protein